MFAWQMFIAGNIPLRMYFMPAFDNKTKRLNVRIELWQRQEIERFVALHTDEYRDLSDFVLTACRNEMNPEIGKARFIRMLKRVLIEDPEIRQILDEHHRLVRMIDRGISEPDGN